MSQAQTAAITEINQGITQVSTVVQSNSATSEEAAAAAEEMSSQAQIMNTVVERFKLRNAHKAPAAAMQQDMAGMDEMMETQDQGGGSDKY